MHRFSFLSLLPAGLLLLTGSLHAQLYELPFDEIIQRSGIVAEGRVVAQQCLWDNAGSHIYTLNTVELTAVYKGSAAAQPVMQVVTCGGRVGDRMELVSELVQYTPGDVGLFCLMPAARDLPVATPVWENYGSLHGFFRYNLSANTVEHPFHPAAGIDAFREKVQDATRELVKQVPGSQALVPVAEGRMAPVVVSFSPTSVTAGTGSMLTISGSGFGSGPGHVQFINSNNGSFFSIDTSDILSWTDTQIEVVVPSTSVGFACAGTGAVRVVDQGGATGTSSTNLTVPYAHTNILYEDVKYGANLVEDNGNGGLTFTLSTNLCSSSNQDAVNAIGRAMRTWRCTSGVNWVFSTSTSGINSPASDGTNIITWDVGSPLPAGTLGIAYSYYGGCFNGGDLYWYVTEVDLNLKQNGVNWYFCDNPASIPGSNYDFQTVVFHELGHGHQLSHVVDVTAVMHRSVSNGQVKRTLNGNEQAGADYVIGLPDHPCGPDPMDLVGSLACLGITLPAACYAAGPCTASLPVELTKYSGAARRDGILLEWETATERNNDFFSLERSRDATTFQPLAKIPGSGQALQPTRYQFLDAEPFPGLNYYRLRQTDFDGSAELLGMVAVAFGSTTNELEVFPNPVSGTTLQIHLRNPDVSDAPFELTLTDLPGRVIRRDIVSNPAHTLEIHDIPPGTYLLQACNTDLRQCTPPVLILRH